MSTGPSRLDSGAVLRALTGAISDGTAPVEYNPPENGEMVALQEKWFGFRMELSDTIPTFS